MDSNVKMKFVLTFKTSKVKYVVNVIMTSGNKKLVISHAQPTVLFIPIGPNNMFEINRVKNNNSVVRTMNFDKNFKYFILNSEYCD